MIERDGVTQITLFRSENVIVRQVGTGGAVCFVTFGFHTPETSLDRPGFGEDFLRGEGIAAIHVLPVDNRWYQYPEMDQALLAVANATQAFERVVTYGCSMGGYAALRFANACGATNVLAISPQFTIDPRRPPFDRRWRTDARLTGFVEPPYAPPGSAIVVFDPDHALDRAQASMFLTSPGSAGVSVRFGGHPAAALLAETGTLQSLVRQVAADAFDEPEFQSALRRARRRSAHYHFVLANRLQYRRPAVAAALLRRALAISRLPHILSTLGTILDRERAFEEAGALHREAVQVAPDNAESLALHAWHLALRGRTVAATKAIQEAICLRGVVPNQRMRVVRTHLRVDRLTCGVYFPLLKWFGRWRGAPLTPSREYWQRHRPLGASYSPPRNGKRRIAQKVFGS